MADNKGRSVVFYVWDNDEQKLVRLYRAVKPEDISKSPAAGFDGYFTIEHLGAFLSSWRQQYADDRYVIRDWLADSAADFHRTRLGWTEEDLSKHLPSQRRGAAEDAPPSRFQVGGVDWEISGIELQTNTIGIPAGILLDKERVIRAMQDFLAGHPGRKAEDVPIQWFRMTTTSKLASLKVFDQYLDEKEGLFADFLVPRMSEDLYHALHKAYDDRARLNADPNDERYYFQTLEDGNLINEWWIGSHTNDLWRAFGDLVA